MATLFMSAQQVKNLTPVMDNVNEIILKKMINEAQESYIRPLLGDTLYEQVNTEITPGPPSAEIQTLIDRLRPTLAWYSYYEFLPESWAKTREVGVANFTSDNAQVVDLSGLTYKRQVALASAERNALQIIKFLDLNSADYPNWTLSPNCNCSNTNLNINGHWFVV